MTIKIYKKRLNVFDIDRMTYTADLIYAHETIYQTSFRQYHLSIVLNDILYFLHSQFLLEPLQGYVQMNQDNKYWKDDCLRNWKMLKEMKKDDIKTCKLNQFENDDNKDFYEIEITGDRYD